MFKTIENLVSENNYMKQKITDILNFSGTSYVICQKNNKKCSLPNFMFWNNNKFNTGVDIIDAFTSYFFGVYNPPCPPCSLNFNIPSYPNSNELLSNISFVHI